ncbi:MAG: hypothetical protein JO058_04220 [Alphaproteobacteria bacterium]|nr:hypothetical protein [Alphaproteobacteria bacterium]MBV9965765.1 hypothetical protein [Alphaproteobacteria bacterium]
MAFAFWSRNRSITMNSIRSSHLPRAGVVGAASQRPRHTNRFLACSQSTMLGAFDWYTVIAIGIAAAVVLAVVIIAWLTGQIPPTK